MPLRAPLDTSFLARGACKGLNHIMFPPMTIRGQHRAELYEQAIAICEGCPVRAQCFDWAMRDPVALGPKDGGIVAGLRPDELALARRAFAAERRANHAPKCGTERGYVRHLELGETCWVCSDTHNRKSLVYAETAS
jgi:ribosomal protein S14